MIDRMCRRYASDERVVFLRACVPQAGGYVFFHLIEREIMADVTESAESKQLLESLKGRMLVLKEHL